MSHPEPRIRALIVDDEPLARRGLQLRLSRYADIEVIGEAANGRDALMAVSTLQPELMFLDVQMPDIDGFAVIRQLPASQLPLIVFVTAHKEHALEAFTANALDYLLKPINHVRLGKSLARARTQLAANDQGARARLPARMSNIQAETVENTLHLGEPARAMTTLAVKCGTRIVRVDIDDIKWIDAAGDYVCVHTGDETHVLRETLSELERRLDPRRFARVHRSTIVNLVNVRVMRPHLNGEYFLVLDSGHEVKLSRSYKDKLRLLV
jgi:two-component system, LytTR family, response regulator